MEGLRNVSGGPLGIFDGARHLLDMTAVSHTSQHSWASYAPSEGMNTFRPTWECIGTSLERRKFYNWASCVREEIGLIKSIISPSSICFLLAPYVAPLRGSNPSLLLNKDWFSWSSSGDECSPPLSYVNQRIHHHTQTSLLPHFCWACKSGLRKTPCWFCKWPIVWVINH